MNPRWNHRQLHRHALAAGDARLAELVARAAWGARRQVAADRAVERILGWLPPGSGGPGAGG